MSDMYGVEVWKDKGRLDRTILCKTYRGALQVAANVERSEAATTDIVYIDDIPDQLGSPLDDEQSQAYFDRYIAGDR